MIVQSNFSNFKTYEQYKKSIKPSKKNNYKKMLLPLVGSAIGVACGMLGSKKIIAKKEKTVLDELTLLLAMMGGANIGSVIAGSIGKKPKEISKKIHEGAFQIMNAAIPMIFVSAVNAICNKTIGKNLKPVRVLASLAAMFSGAFVATKITNATNSSSEPKRKYTLKDSIANVDDLIVTFSFGFDDIAEKLKLDTRLMPFIYAYCAMRAGSKE